MPVVHCGSEWKPGDLPPSGYSDWHEWADVQRKAGIKQVRCGRCCKWRTPQELSGRTFTSEAMDRHGDTHTFAHPICTQCDRSDDGR